MRGDYWVTSAFLWLRRIISQIIWHDEYGFSLGDFLLTSPIQFMSCAPVASIPLSSGPRAPLSSTQPTLLHWINFHDCDKLAWNPCWHINDHKYYPRDKSISPLSACLSCTGGKPGTKDGCSKAFWCAADLLAPNWNMQQSQYAPEEHH